LTSVYKEFCQAFKSQQTAFAHLACLKKVCERVHSEKWKQVKQSLYKLKTEEAKMGSNPAEVETVNTSVMESLFLVVCPLLLTNLFFFDSSFF